VNDIFAAGFDSEDKEDDDEDWTTSEAERWREGRSFLSVSVDSEDVETRGKEGTKANNPPPFTPFALSGPE